MLRKLAGALVIASFVVPGTSHAMSAVEIQANLFRFCSAASTACNPVTDSPSTIYVNTGDTVDWFYNDPGCDAITVCPGHNVTFADGPASTTVKGNTLGAYPNKASIFSRTFTTAGTYTYVCSLHQPFGMIGTIVVSAPGSGW